MLAPFPVGGVEAGLEKKKNSVKTVKTNMIHAQKVEGNVSIFFF